MIKKLLYKYFPPDLRTLYTDNTHEFEKLFLESYIGNIPKDVREPSIAFLAQGREKMEKWGMYMAYALQCKIETDPDKIQFNQGMLTMLKLIMVHVKQPTRTVTRETADGTPIIAVPDPMIAVNEALTGLYTLQKSKDVV